MTKLKLSYWLCLALALVFFFLASFFLVALVSAQLETSETLKAAFLIVLLPYLLSAAAWYGVLWAKRGLAAGQVGQQERQVVALLNASPSGRITVADLMLTQALSLNQAKAILDQMSENGLLEIELEQNGTLTYRFRADVGRQI